jgi:hypothetical protein
LRETKDGSGTSLSLAPPRHPLLGVERLFVVRRNLASANASPSASQLDPSLLSLKRSHSRD